MLEYTWDLNQVGLILSKKIDPYCPTLFECTVLYSEGNIIETKYLPQELILSSIDRTIEMMTFYRDFCSQNKVFEYAPNHMPRYTFDSFDNVGMIIHLETVDTDFENSDFNLYKLVLITSDQYIERKVFRYKYQISDDPNNINRSSPKEYKKLISSENNLTKLQKCIIEIAFFVEWIMG